MTANELPRVAFVGLGAMGAPMARNLVAAGYEVTVANRSRSAVDELAAAGARAADTPAAAALEADIAITMLPDTPDVELVGPELLGALRPGALWIDMSTVSPLAARSAEAAARAADVAFIDAPVSGGVAAATAGSLTVLVGGEDAAVERARPVLAVLGDRVTHVGPIGAGQIAKAANQILVGGTIALVAEAMLLVQALGVDPAPVREALLGGFAQSKVLEVHGRRQLDRTFDAGFRVDLQHKDLSIALDVGREERLALPLTALTRELFGALRAQGGGDLDHSALLLVLERLNARSPEPA